MDGATLSVQLLGGFSLRWGDRQRVALESRRAESLLALLLLNREGPQLRQRVAFLLWPDSAEGQALTNLRHVLHDLRRSLPQLDRYVEVTTRTLCWREDGPTHLDVAAFEDAYARGAWQQAVERYGGDLLAGWDEEWLQEERGRLRRVYLEALERLVAESRENGDLAGAVRHAERLLGEEPLREETYRVLMRLHDALGDRARAVGIYHACAATLEQELGVEPAEETRAEYDALLARDATSRGAVRLGGSPFVGRAAERGALADAWRQAGQGRPHVVLVAGEPGIGKTRLAEEFRAWCVHRGATSAVARAYAGAGALAYGPVVGWLRSEELSSRMPRMARPHLIELARLLPELLATMPNLPRPSLLPESEQRQRLYDAVVHALTPTGGPLLLVADDLQWWDREALQLLQYLVRNRTQTPLLVIGTARREDIEAHPPLAELVRSLHSAGALTEIELARLRQPETALLAELLGGGRLVDADAESLHQQTDGNPLFIVEALHAGWRAGGSVLTPRVQAVIQSRFAQLSPEARDLVDLAATIGREFTVDLLAPAGQLDPDTVIQGLDELWRRRIIREHSATAYVFSHDRIRECAYAALSPIRRRQLHGRVARALEQLAAGELDPVSGRLAHHFEESGAVEHAIAAYERAADVAQRVYAHSESARLLTRALALLATMPDTSARSAVELRLTNALLAPLVAGEGYASPRIHEAHERALALVRSLGVEPTPPLLRSLGLGSLARGDFAAGRAYGDALRQRGDRDDDAVLRVEGEYVLGVSAFWAGELTDAREHLERAVAAFRVEHLSDHLLRFAQDPRVLCLTRLALTCWHLGDAEAAVRARDQGLAIAEQVGHPYSLMVGLQFAALLALDMDDIPALRRYVARGKAVLPEDAGVQLAGGIEAFDAHLRGLRDRPDDAVSRIQVIASEAPEHDQAAPGLRAVLLRILVATCDVAGDARTGLAVADELIALTNSTIWRPEAERLRAKFLAMQGVAEA